MKPIRALTTCLIATLGIIAGFGCRKPVAATEVVPDEVLANVDGNPVTASELAQTFEQASTLADTPSGRRALLDSIVRRRAQAIQARKLGLDADPEIRRAIENVLAGALRTRRLEDRLKSVQVTDEEIRAYYATHPEEFRIRPAVQVAVLFLGARPEDSRRLAHQKSRLEEVRKRATDLRDEVGFGSLAIDCSEHQASRYRGGVVGWLEEESQSRSLESNWVQIAQGLTRDGEISPVTETADGVCLVRLLARRPAAMQTLTNVEGRVRNLLMRAKRQDLEQQFEKQTLDEVPVQVFDERLARLSLSPRRTAEGTKNFDLSLNRTASPAPQ